MKTCNRAELPNMEKLIRQARSIQEDGIVAIRQNMEGLDEILKVIARRKANPRL